MAMFYTLFYSSIIAEITSTLTNYMKTFTLLAVLFLFSAPLLNPMSKHYKRCPSLQNIYAEVRDKILTLLIHNTTKTVQMEYHRYRTDGFVHILYRWNTADSVV